MIDTIIAKAYKTWRENAGQLIVIGTVTWAIPMILSGILGIVAAAFGITDPKMIPEWAIIITTVVAFALMNAFAINGNYAIRKRIFPASSAMKFATSRVLETATALLFSVFPAVTGMLLALIVITLFGESWSALAAILALAGVLGSILFTFLPYYAAEHGWQGAMAHAYNAGRKVYITLILLSIFFALIYITIPALFADPTTGTMMLMLTDIVFLMHIRHQTFFELLDSVEGHG